MLSLASTTPAARVEGERSDEKHIHETKGEKERVAEGGRGGEARQLEESFWDAREVLFPQSRYGTGQYCWFSRGVGRGSKFISFYVAIHVAVSRIGSGLLWVGVYRDALTFGYVKEREQHRDQGHHLGETPPCSGRHHTSPSLKGTRAAATCTSPSRLEDSSFPTGLVSLPTFSPKKNHGGGSPARREKKNGIETYAQGYRLSITGPMPSPP